MIIFLPIARTDLQAEVGKARFYIMKLERDPGIWKFKGDLLVKNVPLFRYVDNDEKLQHGKKPPDMLHSSGRMPKPATGDDLLEILYQMLFQTFVSSVAQIFSLWFPTRYVVNEEYCAGGVGGLCLTWSQRQLDRQDWLVERR